MSTSLDSITFGIILSHIVNGESPQQVCETVGTTFENLLSYTSEHNLSDDLSKAMEMGASSDDDEAPCVLSNRGECATCAE